MPNFSYRPVLLACLIVSVGQFSMGLVFPSLPWISESYGVSIDQTQLLVSMYLLGFGPSQFIYGPLSDTLGRRTVLLGGLLISLVGLSIMLLSSDSFVALVLGRLLQGAGAGCCAVMSRASLRDAYPPSLLSRALSTLAMAASLTPLIAPVLGGMINHHFGWWSVFVVLFCYISLVWLLLYFGFKETVITRRPLPSLKHIVTSYGELMRSRYFRSFAMINWFNFSLIVTGISLMPFIMQQQIGMSSSDYAYWALLPALGLLTGGTLCNRLLPRLGERKLLLLAPCVHLCAGLWFFTAPLTPLAMMFGQLLMCIGNGLAMPCAQSMILIPYKSRAGLAAAFSGGGQMLLSSFMSYLLMRMGMHFAWQFGLYIMLVAVINVLNARRGFMQMAPNEE